MFRFLSRSLLVLFCCLCLGVGTLSTGRALAAHALKSSPLRATQAALTQSDWPSFGYDLSNTRNNVLENTLNPGNISNLFLNWSAQAGGITSESAAVANGIVYVGSNDGKLYAFDEATGTTVWSVPTFNGSTVQVSLPVVANGIVYVSSTGGNLCAFNSSTGALIWQSTANAYGGSVQVANGIVYVGSTTMVGATKTGYLSALNASTGAQLWITPLSSGSTYGSPAVVNGVVYVSSTMVVPTNTGTANTGYLSALNASTGAQLWHVSLGGTNSSIAGPPVVANGVVYVGSNDHNLYAFDVTTGAQIWSVPTAGAIGRSLAVANGVVYVSSYTSTNNVFTGSLYAFNASTGAQIWSTSNGGTFSAPAVANGVVYISSADHHVYAFDASSGAQLWSAPLGGQRTFFAPIVANGVVYVGSTFLSSPGGTFSSKLYAFHLSTPPPANTRWYFAEGSVGGGFTEYLTLLNPSGAQTAHVSVQYLFENQAAVTKSYAVTPSTRFTTSANEDLGIAVDKPQQAISAIVTSDVPIVAERPMYFHRPSDLGSSGTDVVGATDITHTSFYFANGDSSQTSTDTSSEYITVLNPSASQTANITATYYSGGISVGSKTIAVAPLHRGTIGVGDTFKGQAAIQVSSDIGVVVERPIYAKVNVPTTGGTRAGAASTVAATAPGNDWLFAEGHTADNFQENLVLANFDTNATTATIKLEYTNGTVQDVPVTVSGRSQLFFDVNNAFQNPLSGCSCTPTADVSIEVISAAPIVAERVMFFNYKGSIAGMTDVVGEAGPSAHNAYSFAEGFTTNGFEEWLTLQNPNANSEVVAVNLFFAGTIVQKRVTLPAHSRTTLNINDIIVPIASSTYPDIGSNYEVSINVQVIGNGTVVAERPMYFLYQGSSAGDSVGGTDVIGYTGN